MQAGTSVPDQPLAHNFQRRLAYGKQEWKQSGGAQNKQGDQFGMLSKVEENLEQGLEESFPASDPPATTAPAGPEEISLTGVEEVLRRKREDAG